MKKIIIAVFMMSGVFLNWGYGQYTPQDKAEFDQNKTAWADKQAEKLIAFAEKIKDDQYSLNGALRDLDDSLITNYISPEVAKDITRRLTKIYYTLDEQPTNRANKNRIIEIIGLSDNSLDAHEFFLKILENGPQKYREQVLHSLWRVRGDDIYNKIKDLEVRGMISRVNALMSLISASKQRALPELQEFLGKTDDLKDFVIVGVNMAMRYKDPDVMDVVIDRYDYFKSKPIPPEYVKEMYSPDDAFDLKTIELYVKTKEGERYKKALELLNDMGVFGNRKIAWLERKIVSSNLTTRQATVDFLKHQVNVRSVKRENVEPILKNAVDRESNKELKAELKSILKELGK